MALRNPSRINIKDWRGLQTTSSDVNLGIGWWNDSSNIIVTTDGSAACLRSPASFNEVLATGNKVISAFNYEKASGPLILFDISDDGLSTDTYSTTGTTNTSLFTNASGWMDAAPWKRVNVNNLAYGVNGVLFFQTDGSSFTYDVGIRPPSTAPTISYVAGALGSYSVGVSASYAYINSTTGHVSAPSPASNTLGASGGNHGVRIPVIASGTSGVDGIVVFITLDGGSVRYLVIDANGDPQTFSNTTHNIDLNISSILWDTLTPETTYNTIPPRSAGTDNMPGRFLFKYRNRLMLCDFFDETMRGQIAYSAFESVYYGVPWECWPVFNVITLPNKGDFARGGCETPLGAFILGEADSYLIRGTLTDKVSGPATGISVTESIQPLAWSIGTRSPKSICTTPFGVIWLDQNKRIQLWGYDAFPIEAGLPIRHSLGDILDDDDSRFMVEAVWFQHGKDGGQYVLTTPISGSTNNRLYIITIYRDPETGEQRFACAISDIAAQCLVIGNVEGDMRFFMGATDALQELFDLDLSGDGFEVGQQRFFSTIFGNDGEYAYYHSLKFDATSIHGLTITVSNLDGTESKDLEIFREDNSYRAIIDEYGFRKMLTFTFSSSDTEKRIIQNLRIAASGKARLI